MSPSIEQLANKVASMVEDLSKETLILSPPTKRPGWKIFLAGATAGVIVDTSLYPIDTIKSRLQSKAGFIKSGGFAHLYRGLPPVLAGSIPNGEFIFAYYDIETISLV